LFKKKKVTYRKEDPELFLAPKTIQACCFAWLFPGAGHWFLGRKRKAVILGATLLFAMLMGIVQGGDLYPFAGEGVFRSIGAVCELGAGIPYLLSKWVVGRGTPIEITYDYGTIYFLIAGMLNWLCVVDSFDIAVNRK